MMNCVVKLCTLSTLQQPYTSSSLYFQIKEIDSYKYFPFILYKNAFLIGEAFPSLHLPLLPLSKLFHSFCS